MDARELAYKKLRAAAHRLLCAVQPRPGGGYQIKSTHIDALERALTRADALEQIFDPENNKSEGGPTSK